MQSAAAISALVGTSATVHTKKIAIARSVARHDAAIPALIGTSANTGTGLLHFVRSFDSFLFFITFIEIANPRTG